MPPRPPQKGLQLFCLESSKIFASVCTFNCTPNASPHRPGPSSLPLIHRHTHTHISAPTFTRHFSTRAPPLLSPPPVAVSFCRFSPFLSICPFFKGELHSLYFNFIDEPPPPGGEGGRRNGNARGTRPYFRDGFMVLGRSL